MNPWLKVPYEDYERHMSDEDVYQLQTLNSILKTHLNELKPKSVLVLGCTGGNGFEHINDEITQLVVGVDINKDYIDRCRRIYENKNYILDLRCMDISTEDIAIQNIDFISCALLLEYVDNQSLLNKIKKVMDKSSKLNIVIQRNNKHGFVSDTGIESLNVLNVLCNEVDEDKLENLLVQSEYEIESKEIHKLPNGKEFLSYICKCSNY